ETERDAGERLRAEDVVLDRPPRGQEKRVPAARLEEARDGDAGHEVPATRASREEEPHRVASAGLPAGAAPAAGSGREVSASGREGRASHSRHHRFQSATTSARRSEDAPASNDRPCGRNARRATLQAAESSGESSFKAATRAGIAGRWRASASARATAARKG